MEGLVAIETVQNGVEMAVPVSVVASSAPALDDPAPPEVIKGAFEAYKMRAKGSPVTRLPKSVTAAGAKVAPRPDWLTGVQYRLNALGFGAGPVDGIMGPRTRKAVQAFQRTYPPLAVDGVPGPKTQAMLVQVCGY
jgi:TctA family transporter